MLTEDGTIYHVQSFFVGDPAMCDLLDALTIEAIKTGEVNPGTLPGEIRSAAVV